MENEIIFMILTKLISKDMYEEYKYYFLENAIIYAIDTNDIEFINYIKNNINNIKYIVDNEILFKAKIIESFLKNVIKNINIDNLDFTKDLNNKIINDNKDLFNKINNIFNSKTYFLTNYYRKIMIDFVNKFKRNKNIYELLDQFFCSDKLDEFFIKNSSKLVDKNNINSYKKILIKLIISDSYIMNENIKQEYEEDDYIDDDALFDDAEEILLEITEDILDYIDYSIKNNSYLLPTEDELRYNMYGDFLELNYDEKDKYNYIKNIENDKEKVLKLKKINPLYKFENINMD